MEANLETVATGGRPVLSICITTYKRAHFIGETLESLLRDASDAMEVVVVDGASPDNTAEVVEPIARRNPCVRYFRETENLGIDGDFDKAIRYARGEYCWLFSDDDLLKPGAIPAILRRLDRPYSALVVNAEVRSVDLQRLLQASRLSITADRVYGPEEIGALFEDNVRHLSFIGALIVRRSVWLGRNSRQYYGSYFVHIGVLFQEPLPGPVLAVAQPLIEIRYGNASWTARYFEIVMFKWPDLLWGFSAIGDAARLRVVQRAPWKSWKKLMLLRAMGAFTREIYQTVSQRNRFDAGDRRRLRALLLIPGWLANLAACAYMFFFVKDRDLGFVDLVNSPYYIWRRRSP